MNIEVVYLIVLVVIVGFICFAIATIAERSKPKAFKVKLPHAQVVNRKKETK